MKNIKFKFPSEKIVEGILKKWDSDHGKAWDYDADKRAVNNALKRYAKKIQQLNKLDEKGNFPLI